MICLFITEGVCVEGMSVEGFEGDHGDDDGADGRKEIDLVNQGFDEAGHGEREDDAEDYLRVDERGDQAFHDGNFF